MQGGGQREQLFEFSIFRMKAQSFVRTDYKGGGQREQLFEFSSKSKRTVTKW